MNKEKKYTPGPWVPDLTPGDVRSPIGDVAVVVYAGMTRIEVTGKESTLAPISQDEAYANARLISAAPMLLEALTVAREWMRGDKWRNSTVEKHASWEAVMRGIDAAIAAATGETK